MAGRQHAAASGTEICRDTMEWGVRVKEKGGGRNGNGRKGRERLRNKNRMRGNEEQDNKRMEGKRNNKGIDKVK